LNGPHPGVRDVWNWEVRFPEAKALPRRRFRSR